MISLCSQGDNAGHEQGEDIARIVLDRSDLPLMYRLRACTVLAGACDEESLTWAEEAVRLTQVAAENSGQDLQKKQALLENAIAVHDQVKQTMTRLASKAATTASEPQPAAPDPQNCESEGKTGRKGGTDAEGDRTASMREILHAPAKRDEKQFEEPKETADERMERMIAEMELQENEQEERERAYREEKRKKREAEPAKEAEAAAKALSRQERQAEEREDQREREKEAARADKVEMDGIAKSSGQQQPAGAKTE